ncbi:MAG: hypothetical protein AAF438_13790 [Pseudomonadota bacterium]
MIPNNAMLCCLTFFLVSASLYAEQNSALSDFKVSVYKDSPGVKSLLSGNHSEAIHLASKWVRIDPFPSHMTLCASNLKEANIEQAEKHCHAALRESKKGQTSWLRPSRKQTRKQRAMALSNLGILAVLLGDEEKATHRFRTAVSLDPDNQSAKYNLAVKEANEPRMAQGQQIH